MAIILNDFNITNTLNYESYVEAKSFPLYELKSLQDNTVKKVSRYLEINKNRYDLTSMSINDVFTLLLDSIPSLEIYIYKENTKDFLSNSALFLCDFNTTRVEEVNIINTPTDISPLYTFTDKYSNLYKLVSFKLYDSFRNVINYKLEDNYLQASFVDYGKMHITYKCENFKGRALEEYPITSLEQLDLTSEGI